MVRLALATLAASSLLLIGCGTVPASQFNANEEKPSSVRAPEAADALGTTPLSVYTAVMTPRERHEYVRQKESEHQWRYIRSHGIDIRYEMQDRLCMGMSRAAVEQAFADRKTMLVQRNDPNVLHYSIYNGETNTHAVCFFDGEPGAEPGLVDFTSYTNRDIAHLATLENRADDLRTKLNAVLRQGMGVNEITNSVTKARQQQADFKLAMKDQLDRPESQAYSGYSAPSERGDYQIAAELQRSDAMVRAYEVLDREPNFIRREVHSEYWYHVVPDVYGDERYIVIEYRFRNSQLHSWHVYVTDFLGFGEYKHQ